MPSCFYCLCLPPCYLRPSHSKRSNLSTLRKILLHLASADNETNVEVNRLIQKILSDLLSSYACQSNLSSRDRAPDSSVIDRCTLNELEKCIKRGAASPSSLPSYPDQRPRFPRPLANQPQCPGATAGDLDSVSYQPDSDSRTNLLTQFFRKCSASQLELLLQFEPIRNWTEYLAASRLEGEAILNSLPPLLPRPCSRSFGGRIRISSWNLGRFSVSKARHPGFRETVCLALLRANISLVVLQEIADLDVANMIDENSPEQSSRTSLPPDTMLIMNFGGNLTIRNDGLHLDLCEELNSPTLPHIREWMRKYPPSFVPCWEAATSIQSTGAMFRGPEYAVFLYNKNAGVEITRTGLLGAAGSKREVGQSVQTQKLFARCPCTALCHIRKSRFIITSVHLKAGGLRNSRVGRTIAEVENLGNIVRAFNDTRAAGTYLMILGDFNLNSEHEAFDSLRKEGMFSVLNGSQPTTTAAIDKNRSSSDSSGEVNLNRLNQSAYDNAWLSPELASVDEPLAGCAASYTGDSGILTCFLRHPLIPNETGAGANGFASDHCPIWFDLNIS